MSTQRATHSIWTPLASRSPSNTPAQDRQLPSQARAETTERHCPGWRIHGSVEDTKLSTNKQHSLLTLSSGTGVLASTRQAASSLSTSEASAPLSCPWAQPASTRHSGGVAESPIPSQLDHRSVSRLHTPPDARELFATRGVSHTLSCPSLRLLVCVRLPD